MRWSIRVPFVNHLPELLDLREPTELDQRLDDALLLLRSVVAPLGSTPG